MEESELERTHLYVLRDTTQQELQRLGRCIELEQEQVTQTGEYIDTLNNELKDPGETAENLKQQLRDLHATLTSNRMRQTQLREKLHSLFETTARVDEVILLKKTVVQRIVDILHNPPSHMRTALLDSEETATVTAIEDARFKIDQLQTEQQQLQQKLASTNSSIELHSQKEDKLLLTLTERTCLVTECTIQEHEVQCEIGRLESVESLEEQSSQIAETTAKVNQLTHQVEFLSRENDKSRNLVSTQRKIIGNHAESLAVTKVELSACQDIHSQKTEVLSNVNQEQTDLLKEVSIKDHARRTDTRTVHEQRGVSKQNQSNVKSTQQELTWAEADLEKAKMDLVRAEDTLGSSTAQLALKPRNRTYISNVQNAERAVEISKDLLAGAERRVSFLQGKEQTYQDKVKEAEDTVLATQANMRQDKESLQGLQKSLHDVKKRLTRTNTLAVDAQSKCATMEVEMNTLNRLLDEANATLRENCQQFLEKSQLRKQAVQELVYESITLKHLTDKHNTCKIYRADLHTKTKSLVLNGKSHRKELNSATTKLAQMKRRIANLHQQRETQAVDLMQCNYEIYLCESTQSLYWLAMKLVTRDFDAAEKVLLEEGHRYGIVPEDLAAKQRTLLECNAEVSELHVNSIQTKKQIQDTIAALPPPFTSVYRKTLLKREAEQAHGLHKALLDDYLLQQGKLEEDVLEFDEQLNSLTVEEQLKAHPTIPEEFPPIAHLSAARVVTAGAASP